MMPASRLDAFKTFDTVTLFGGIGYTIFGSTSVSPLENVFNYTVGGSVRYAERDSIGISYDEREPVVASGPWQRESTLFGSRRFEDGLAPDPLQFARHCRPQQLVGSWMGGHFTLP